MAFVGPRPAVRGYAAPDRPAWKEILQARPGLTDPVTLRFRHEEMLMADVGGDREAFYRETLQPLKIEGYREYLGRRNWRSDVVVLAQTLGALLWPGRNAAPRASELRGIVPPKS